MYNFHVFNHFFIQVPHIAAGGKYICVCKNIVLNNKCALIINNVKYIPISLQIISTSQALRKLYIQLLIWYASALI